MTEKPSSPEPAPQFLNRELSWIEFNERVLAEALDDSVPLLERVKFLAITASNLDEFFMVRVGGMQALERSGLAHTDPSGLSATQQLDLIARRSRELARRQYACLNDELLPKLAENGIRRLVPSALSDRQRAYVENYFDKEIFSVVTPIALYTGDPGANESSIVDKGVMSLPTDRTLHLLVRLEGDASEKERWAIVPLVRTMPRFVTIPTRGAWEFLLLEDLVTFCIDRLFPGVKVLETAAFRVIRNADLELQEDQAADLLLEMKGILDARRVGDVVRLELASNASKVMQGVLQETINVAADDVYRLPGPLDLAAFMRLTEVADDDALRNESWPPQPVVGVDTTESMFDVLTRENLILHHPYESYEPVVRLLNEAADDPGVLAIKQTLYRTSPESPIVAALIRAAVKGKYVTAIVELKARFDEARNIEWATALERAGVQVIYGVKRLKTHAKCLMIVRRESGGIRRYLHFGTGNYNEITARFYTDISFMTSDDAYGADAAAFFNAMTGVAEPRRFERIFVAPLSLRDRLMELIEGETQRRREGQPAFIRAKMNSLTDPRIIRALYGASSAGVKVELNVRGICCLSPRVPGLSENISVVSIVDRMLEHSRIFHFHQNGEDVVYIASADWMSRNLDHRVELMIPVFDTEGARKLIQVLDTCLKSNVKTWRLLADGNYERRATAQTKTRFRAQEFFYDLARQAVIEDKRRRSATFEPYTPKKM